MSKLEELIEQRRKASILRNNILRKLNDINGEDVKGKEIIKSYKIMLEGYNQTIEKLDKIINKMKKKTLKQLMGSASSKSIDFNKVRDEWRSR